MFMSDTGKSSSTTNKNNDLRRVIELCFDGETNYTSLLKIFVNNATKKLKILIDTEIEDELMERMRA